MVSPSFLISCQVENSVFCVSLKSLIHSAPSTRAIISSEKLSEIKESEKSTKTESVEDKTKNKGCLESSPESSIKYILNNNNILLMILQEEWFCPSYLLVLCSKMFTTMSTPLW